jgi:hypothetical protein
LVAFYFLSGISKNTLLSNDWKYYILRFYKNQANLK